MGGGSKFGFSKMAKSSCSESCRADERPTWLWLLAGPNGAGKSTYAPKLAARVEEIVRPDELANQLSPARPKMPLCVKTSASFAAARLAAQEAPGDGREQDGKRRRKFRATNVQFRHVAAGLSGAASLEIDHDRAGSAFSSGLVDRDQRCGTGDWRDFLCRQFAGHALFASRAKIRLVLRASIRLCPSLLPAWPGEGRICPSHTTRLF